MLATVSLMTSLFFAGRLSKQEQDCVIGAMEQLIRDHKKKDAEGPSWTAACELCQIPLRRHMHTLTIDSEYTERVYDLDYSINDKIRGRMRQFALMGDVKAAGLILGQKIEFSARMVNADTPVASGDLQRTDEKVARLQEQKTQKAIAQQPKSVAAEFLRLTHNIPTIIDLEAEAVKGIQPFTAQEG